eukprot:5291017-Ditylum_brightwellii.AAC.1
MLDFMKKELCNNNESEHTSPMGIALLWERVTGSMQPSMIEVVSKVKATEEAGTMLLNAAKECFLQYAVEGTDSMDYK